MESFKLSTELLWSDIESAGNWVKEISADLYRKIKRETEKCNGDHYNPKIECCKNKKVYSNKIKSLSDCPPPRYKKGSPDTSDYGCGKNGIIREELLKMGYTLGIDRSIDNPTGGKHTSFFSPCYIHDSSYGACNSGAKTDEKYRADADTMFLNNMLGACNGDNVEVAEKYVCREWAKNYYRVVYDVGGEFYESAQLENCKCCP